jgi:hypothetical protein
MDKRVEETVIEIRDREADLEIEKYRYVLKVVKNKKD